MKELQGMLKRDRGKPGNGALVKPGLCGRKHGIQLFLNVVQLPDNDLVGYSCYQVGCINIDAEEVCYTSPRYAFPQVEFMQPVQGIHAIQVGNPVGK